VSESVAFTCGYLMLKMDFYDIRFSKTPFPKLFLNLTVNPADASKMCRCVGMKVLLDVALMQQELKMLRST